MNILITGGTGFIGSHIAVQLLNNNYNIIIVDNFYNSNPNTLNNIKKITNKDVTFYKCDLLNFEQLENIFKENKIDFVIHLAGLKSVKESTMSPIKYYENNITGSINLFKVMEKYNVLSLIFSSSATVYSNNPSPHLETTPSGNCTNPYGTTKLFIEQILKDMCASNDRWNITVLRYYNPIGANKTGLIGESPIGIPNNLFPYITQVAVGKLPILTIHGNDFDTIDGTGMRDFIHVEDLANGHILSIEKQKKGYNIYNLGTGKATSVLQLIKTFEDASGIKIPYKFGPRREGDISIAYADISKATKELGFAPKYNLYEMCEDSLRWQKKNQNEVQ